ncbi:MAG: choice-of-anchor tandem repeat GloVer-containing protein [Bryobacteraceae bacterium]
MACDLGLGRSISARLFFCAATAIALPAQTFTTLVNFDFWNNGDSVYSSLVQGFDGNYYGTTSQGWPCNQGTIYKVTPTGILTTLYRFPAQPDCSAAVNGGNPYATLVLATDGNFYGTATTGGTNPCPAFNGYQGCGTVFKITPTGTLTTLHNFDGADGANPFAALVQAANGGFYGTTYLDGTNAYGTAFRITAAGTLTTLHSFTPTEGGSPGALIQATNGNFYGRTNGDAGAPGTFFRITPTGALTTLHNFSWSVGFSPAAADLVQAADGNFYGTTYSGGSNDCNTGTSPGCGTVFKITPAGVLTTLYSFNSIDGANPNAGLVQGTDGNFYGTTSGGGINGGYGTVFKLTPAGKLTTLHSFDKTDGFFPNGLVQATNGNFYGTTLYGGINDYGTIFSVSVGLSPFIKTLLTSGKVGAVVKILGTNLTGATTVTFNGTAAAFTVVRPSLITTTVPVGATTGKVRVVTSTRTLVSNIAFRVTPVVSGFLPTSGTAGTVVVITGESLAGATTVSFGGAKATSFSVDSNTQITAAVPAGAKSGSITVTTPGGIAVSGGTFTVN